MLNKKIAKRYARALIEIGKERKQVEQFQKELKNFSNLLKKFPDLNKCLSSPLYSAEECKQTISTLNKKINLSKTIQNFLYLLVDKRRIQWLTDIVEAYEDLTNETLGFMKAKIITATPLSNKNFNKIKKLLEDITKRKILLDTETRPQIIGGAIAEVGDKVFDGSIRNQLRKIGETLV